jgi:hypothetical protein
LDNYYNTRPGVAAQATCAAATSAAAINQQWYAGAMDDSVYLSQTSASPSWLFGTNLYLDVGKTGYVLTESLSAGQLTVAGASNYAASNTATYANAQWYLAPSYQLANCSDGPFGLPGTTTRVKRSIASDTQDVYRLLGIMDALLVQLEDTWPNLPTVTLVELTATGSGTYTFQAPTGKGLTFQGVTLTATPQVDAGPAVSIYLTMLEAGPVLGSAATGPDPVLDPAVIRTLGVLDAIREQILNITLSYITQPQFVIPQLGCAASYRNFGWK